MKTGKIIPNFMLLKGGIMSTSLLYHTQGTYGFQLLNYKFKGKSVIAEVTQNSSKFKCQRCSSRNVKATFIKNRLIQGLPMGSQNFYLSVRLHRIKCHDCKSYLTEEISFIPSQKVHYTRKLAETIIQLRPEMSILAISKYFNLQWNTVKEIEKKYLKKKYKHIKLKNTEYIGIDEIHIGQNGFLTIVRDLKSGNVLHIGNGKGNEALDGFTLKLKKSKAQIKAVSLDFGRAYTKWAKEVIPNAEIVYDHFHLIKLMNDKLDKIRRSTMIKLEEEEKKKLKNKRWLFLKNIENLEKDTKEELKELRLIYDDLGTASLMKESLRNIYSIAEYDSEAEFAFEHWCKMAVGTGISYLKTMAKTIMQNIKGIVSFWNTKISNAHMEGFNNKIRWLNKQAYGYRDLEFLKLKIFDLPNAKEVKL